MDPNQPAQNETIDPRKVPHLPISEAEMHPEIYQDNPSGSKNTLLTLASLLVLAGIVGITLFLYIQNRTAKSPQLTNKTNIPENKTESIITPTPNFEKKPEQLLTDHGVVCKRFNSIEDALNEPEVACVLDLSGKKLNSIPQNLLALKNINEIDLNDNNLSNFPMELLQLKKLTVIRLSNNKITTFKVNTKDITLPMNLQKLELTNNNISDITREEIMSFFGKQVSIVF